MAQHPLAGKPATPNDLIDVDALLTAYYEVKPDPENPAQQVSFGTSGHRGSSINASFNRDHILAIAQAVCEYRQSKGIDGPLFIGIDTHALSKPALDTSLEVLAANGVTALVQSGGGPTPTPVISHAILVHNRKGHGGQADGIVITPSHNPPEDGGFKYNPPHGGPAGEDITGWIQQRANQLMSGNNQGVKRLSSSALRASGLVEEYDYVQPYVRDLAEVIDLAAIRRSGLRLGVDPLGGSNIAYWQACAERHNLPIEIVNDKLDPTFSFMTLDKDGKIRMDCSSPFAMASLIRMKDDFDLACGTDPDSDRHGIVTPSSGLLNPNHYLAVSIDYLYRHRTEWSPAARIGKTLVSSAMIDRVAAALSRPLAEVPVGFKWFVDGLLAGTFAFGGEESAGASFLRRNGQVWTTDKDGIILCLLAAEITAVTGRDPGHYYRGLTEKFGEPCYERLDAPANAAQKAKLKALSPHHIKVDTLAGQPILQKLTHAPGNGAAIGGLKVVSKDGWFAARPSGTEDVYKIYTESFLGSEHLKQIQQEAQTMVSAIF